MGICKNMSKNESNKKQNEGNRNRFSFSISFKKKKQKKKKLNQLFEKQVEQNIKEHKLIECQ